MIQFIVYIRSNIHETSLQMDSNKLKQLFVLKVSEYHRKGLPAFSKARKIFLLCYRKNDSQCLKFVIITSTLIFVIVIFVTRITCFFFLLSRFCIFQ
jgi:hypothetical protein